MIGNAFEYALAQAFVKIIPALKSDNSAFHKAEQHFAALEIIQQHDMNTAAKEAVEFLITHDKRLLSKELSVDMVLSSKGQSGDVRDIIISKSDPNGYEIGISAKHRNDAVKHSRLSDKIDFGYKWFGVPCSQHYFDTICPVFKHLRKLKEEGQNWKELKKEDKEKIYLRVLSAFQEEFQHLYKTYPSKIPERLLKYLLGVKDYYQIIKENWTVTVTSFNINRTLKWGPKLKMPDQIKNIDRVPNSNSQLKIIFNNGWQLLFRIHNAETKVVPSLKFDIRIQGWPKNIASHKIPINTKGSDSPSFEFL